MGGGGTDLPAFYRKHGGNLWSATIDKYVYVNNDGTSTSDLPEGIGMGGSGAYKVGLLKAQNPSWDARQLAEAVDELGKQDQYCAAYGGFLKFHITKKGEVSTTRLDVPPRVVRELESKCLLFYTHQTHSSQENLAEQERKVSSGESENAMLRIMEIGSDMLTMVKLGQLRDFGKKMHEHWEVKRTVTDRMTNPHFDKVYESARALGAEGGKLIGSGGGGCFLFWVPKHQERFIQDMTGGYGLEHIPYRFTNHGSEIV